MGDTVGIPDHQNGTYYLHRAHTSDPGFLVVSAEGSTVGSGCSADEPGADGKQGRTGLPSATAMTAAELMKAAGEDEVITSGT